MAVIFCVTAVLWLVLWFTAIENEDGFAYLLGSIIAGCAIMQLMDIWDDFRLTACQANLPRSQHCVLVAVPESEVGE